MKRKANTASSRLIDYSALAASFLVMSAGASAAVQHTDVNTLVDDFDFLIDFDGDGTIDINVFNAPGFTYVGSGTYGSGFTSYRYVDIIGVRVAPNAVVGFGGYFTGSFAYASALGAGAIIGSTGTAVPNVNESFAPFGFATMNYGSNFGQWTTPGMDAYIGLRFTSGSGGQHNAWVRIHILSADEFELIDYAYEDTPGASIVAGDTGGCNSAVAPVNLAVVNGATEVTISWDPISGSVGCQVEATRTAPPGPTVTQNLLGADVSSVSIPNSVAPGTTWDWRVRCACSLAPIDATPFSAYSSLTFPAPPPLKQATTAALYPNPAAQETIIELAQQTARDTRVEITDLLGRVVDWMILPAARRQLRLDLSGLEGGLYFVQVGGLPPVILEIVQ